MNVGVYLQAYRPLLLHRTKALLLLFISFCTVKLKRQITDKLLKCLLPYLSRALKY